MSTTSQGDPEGRRLQSSLRGLPPLGEIGEVRAPRRAPDRRLKAGAEPVGPGVI